MLYSEIRPKIRTGDLLAWEVTTISSALDLALLAYQKIYKTNISHVGMAYVFGDRVFCLEATPPAVRLIPLSMLDDFSLLQANIDWKPSYDRVALKYIGRDYSLTDHLKGMMHFKTSDKELYCSELLSRIYRDIGLVPSLEADSTPRGLAREVKKVVGGDFIFVNIDKGNI
jgi:hypothetical protein